MAEFETRKEESKPLAKPEGDFIGFVADNVTKPIISEKIAELTASMLETYALYRLRMKQRSNVPTMMLKDHKNNPVSISAECETLRNIINRQRAERARYVELANELQEVGWNADALFDADETLKGEILDVGAVAVDLKDLK